MLCSKQKGVLCENWKDFETRLAEIRKAEIKAERTAKFLFRGHNDSDWKLETTLERRGWKDMHLSKYYQLISSIKPQVETYTGNKWNLRKFPDVEREFDSLRLGSFPGPEESRYMTYLRHHGFPSPLLDWTRSRYIAAYFAFRSVTKPPTKRMVSINVLSESPKGYKSHSAKESHIISLGSLGPYMGTHKRHFLQQSDYTISVNSIPVWRFASHENVVTRSDPYRGFQDFIWKFNIPWTLQDLRLLDAYNLNAFSLFESEEALMETLALRGLEFGEIDFGENPG